MEVKCFIILRKLSEQEKKRILGFPGSDIYASDKVLAGELPADLIDISEDTKREINYGVFKRVNSFYSEVISKSQDLNRLSSGGFYFWFYHKFRIYFLVRNLKYEIEIIRSINKENIEIEVFGENEAVKKLLLQENIIYHVIPKPGRKLSQLISFAIATILRYLTGLISRRDVKGKILILDNRENYGKIRTRDNGRQFRNSQLDYLLYNADGNEIVLLDKFSPPGAAQTFRLKSFLFRKMYKYDRVPEENILFSFSTLKRQREAKKMGLLMLNELQKIIPDGEIQSLILEGLRNLTRSSAFFYHKFLSYRDFFNSNKPSVVLLTDEYSPNTRVIMDAAKSTGIPVVSFQHGSMHELHPGYTYNENDPRDEITPDCMIVWGEKWKEFLVENGYPEKKIEIAGHLRTDIIQQLNLSPPDPVSILGEQVLNKKIITFASQPQRDPALKRKTAEEIFKSVKDLSKVILVVKLHPVETDPGYYQSIAENVGCKNYRIFKDVDLYELISISEAVITSFSTVGSEAVYFHKPVLVYDPLQQDVLGLVRKGVAIQCVSAGDLTLAIQKIIEKDFMVDESKISVYINGQVFAIDGNTAKRYLTILKSFQ